MGIVADVTPCPCDVSASPHDTRQARAAVDPAGIGRRASIAQQQGASITVGERLALRRGVVDCSVSVQSDVTVGIHQARKHPAGNGLNVRARGRVIGDPTRHDPELVADLLGSDQNASLDVQHRRGHARDPIHALLPAARGPTRARVSGT